MGQRKKEPVVGKKGGIGQRYDQCAALALFVYAVFIWVGATFQTNAAPPISVSDAANVAIISVIW